MQLSKEVPETVQEPAAGPAWEAVCRVAEEAERAAQGQAAGRAPTAREQE